MAQYHRIRENLWQSPIAKIDHNFGFVRKDVLSRLQDLNSGLKVRSIVSALTRAKTQQISILDQAYSFGMLSDVSFAGLSIKTTKINEPIELVGAPNKISVNYRLSKKHYCAIASKYSEIRYKKLTHPFYQYEVDVRLILDPVDQQNINEAL